MHTHYITLTINVPIPDWAEWLAQDGDGTWWVYDVRPVIKNNNPVWAAPKGTESKMDRIAT